MDARDAALARAFPICAVPRFGTFEPLGANGQRLLVASNGFFLEVRRDWLYAVHRCAQQDGAVRYPFGDMKNQIVLPIAAQLWPLVRQFIPLARAHLPAEVGAAGVFDRLTGRCALVPCDSLSASSTRLEYAPPLLTSTQSLAVDLHSHGAAGAFFSATDDADDIAAVKVAVCVGRVDTDEPEADIRLCLSGLFLDLTIRSVQGRLQIEVERRADMGTLPSMQRSGNL